MIKIYCLRRRVRLSAIEKDDSINVRKLRTALFAVEVCEQIWRNSITNVPVTSIRNTRHFTDDLNQADLSTHSRETEHYCRPSQQTVHSSVRTANFEEVFQSDSMTMDRYKNAFAARQNKVLPMY
ncbi:hypothetical protein BCV71DRAFT_231202 [Rhizopus microsporus]|uniref:Uncharacterized protein n=1 Tax=Rhizopus microsporus TaxID=58291 RepID=A0A1X0SEX2_RHIZD|nr:hypothetical protein BCV71DRAFT_231202 [Rhizopus microsporus]